MNSQATADSSSPRSKMGSDVFKKSTNDYETLAPLNLEGVVELPEEERSFGMHTYRVESPKEEVKATEKVEDSITQVENSEVVNEETSQETEDNTVTPENTEEKKAE